MGFKTKEMADWNTAELKAWLEFRAAAGGMAESIVNQLKRVFDDYELTGQFLIDNLDDLDDEGISATDLRSLRTWRDEDKNKYPERGQRLVKITFRKQGRSIVVELTVSSSLTDVICRLQGKGELTQNDEQIRRANISLNGRTISDHQWGQPLSALGANPDLAVNNLDIVMQAISGSSLDSIQYKSGKRQFAKLTSDEVQVWFQRTGAKIAKCATNFKGKQVDGKKLLDIVDNNSWGAYGISKKLLISSLKNAIQNEILRLGQDSTSFRDAFANLSTADIEEWLLTSNAKIKELRKVIVQQNRFNGEQILAITDNNDWRRYVPQNMLRNAWINAINEKIKRMERNSMINKHRTLNRTKLNSLGIEITSNVQECIPFTDESDNAERVKLRGCGHGISPNNLLHYMYSEVGKPNVVKLQCPADKCTSSVSWADCYAICDLSYDEAEYFERRLFARKHRLASCPRCDISIAKPQGFNHFRIACSCGGGDFCYNCGKTWRGGGTSNCGNDKCDRTPYVNQILNQSDYISVAGVTAPKVRACPWCYALLAYHSGCQWTRCQYCCDKAGVGDNSKFHSHEKSVWFCHYCLKPKKPNSWGHLPGQDCNKVVVPVQQFPLGTC